MKKILGTFFLIFSVFMLSFAQHDEGHSVPKDTISTETPVSVLDTLISDDSTKHQVVNQLNEFYSQSDSGKVNVAIINVQQKETQANVEAKEETENLKLFTWWRFFWMSLFFLGLYFLLHFLDRVLIKYNFLGKFQRDIKSWISHSLLIFESFALLILGGAFILINPIYHGAIALLILIAGFSHVRNYFSGRIVQFDPSVEEGKRLKTLDSQGVIFKMGRLGLKMRTQKGVQFVNYSKLISDGYTLLSGEEVGGFYELEIQPKDLDAKKDYLTFLDDLFTTAPYLDLRFRHQVETVDVDSKTYLARVEVKEESHLQDLVTMIRERNFNCKVTS